MAHRNSAGFQEDHSYDKDSFQVTQEEDQLVEEDFLNESLPSKLNRQSDINHQKRESMIEEEIYGSDHKQTKKQQDEDHYDEESFAGEETLQAQKPEVETRTSMKGSLRTSNNAPASHSAYNEKEEAKKDSISTINTDKNGISDTIASEIKRNAQLAGVMISNTNKVRASLPAKVNANIRINTANQGKPPALLNSQKPATTMNMNKISRYPIKSGFQQIQTSQTRTNQMPNTSKNSQQQGLPSRPQTGASMIVNKPLAGNILNSDLKNKARIHSSQGASQSFVSAGTKPINDRASTAATSIGQFQNPANKFQRSGTNFRKINVAPLTTQSQKAETNASSRVQNLPSGKTSQSNFTNNLRSNLKSSTSMRSGVVDRIKGILPPFLPGGQKRQSTSMSSTNRSVSQSQTHTQGFNKQQQAQKKVNPMSQSQTKPFYQRQPVQKIENNNVKWANQLSQSKQGRNSNLVASGSSQDKYLIKSQSNSRSRIQSAQVRSSYNNISHMMSASKQKHGGFGRNSFYGGLNMSASKGDLSNRSLSGANNFMGAGFRIITNSNPPDINNLEKQVKSLKISDYYDPHPESLLDKSESQKLVIRPSSSIQALLSLQDPLNGRGNLLDYEFPIKILDNLIQHEEEAYGFSLFNRGQELKKSLIDASKVKSYILNQAESHNNILSPGQYNSGKTQIAPSAPKNEKQEWNDVLTFFKANPKALLDAIPTPRGEEEKALREFKKGFLQKNEMNFSLNETQTNGFGFKPRNSSAFDNYKTSSSGMNTPSRRLQSPKQNSTLNSTRKLNESQSKLKDALQLNRNSSRKSISSPYKNQWIPPKTFTNSFKERDLQRNMGCNNARAGLTQNSFGDPYSNLTTDENINLNQTTESTRLFQNQSKDFRISTGSIKNTQMQRKAQSKNPSNAKENVVGRMKQRTLHEEQQKQALERKLQQDKIKSKIKKDYLIDNSEVGGIQSSIEAKESIISLDLQPINKHVSAQKVGGKSVIDYLDWKHSKVFTDYITKRVNCRQVMDGKEFADMLKEDEIDYVKLMVTKKLKDPKNTPEVVKICEQNIPRAFNTIEYLLKEILSEQYFTWEFDPMFHERNFQGNSIKTLQYLLDKMRSLFNLRDSLISFLSKIQNREQVLKEMKETVMSLQSDEQIEQHYNIKGLTDDVSQVDQPHRLKIQDLGNTLMDCTDEVLRSLKRFYTQFNSSFEFVFVQHFLYENADYREVSIREVREIRDVFNMFDIEIRELQANLTSAKKFTQLQQAAAVEAGMNQ